ncbi:hypothetical protein B0T26DRAFT_280428 [Lasiosphaeria miniovina]|uniref:Uncharacterized protein n=1 Tax=Lasiosphaeria miniovina TaxID=1954250 RepID=A0AA40AJM4_9PEZI|nr:uncharacterized protein B0T26DRAFT_280428 [Lasiosphaeria miniovina]KAK0717091.1 hypothetical protein B0T26DRAFT_280428 [Lasiosphaeria miniovina]
MMTTMAQTGIARPAPCAGRLLLLMMIGAPAVPPVLVPDVPELMPVPVPTPTPAPMPAPTPAAVPDPEDPELLVPEVDDPDPKLEPDPEPEEELLPLEPEEEEEEDPEWDDEPPRPPPEPPPPRGPRVSIRERAPGKTRPLPLSWLGACLVVMGLRLLMAADFFLPFAAGDLFEVCRLSEIFPTLSFVPFFRSADGKRYGFFSYRPCLPTLSRLFEISERLIHYIGTIALRYSRARLGQESGLGRARGWCAAEGLPSLPSSSQCGQLAMHKKENQSLDGIGIA